jgi:hypothetical protein
VRFSTWDGLDLAFALLGFLAFAVFSVVPVPEIVTGLPCRLKTFKQMKTAFRKGKKTHDNRRVAAIYALRDFAKQGATADQREEIANIVRGGIEEYMHSPSHRMDSEVWCMLETLAAAAPEWEASFLEEVIRSEVSSRDRAISRLVQLRGPDCLEFLVKAADDAGVANYVADAIPKLGAAAAKPFVIQRLRTMLGETQNTWAPSAAARALIALGHAADPALASRVEKFDPWTRFAFRAKIANIDAPALIEKLFSAGIVGEARRHLLNSKIIRKMQKALDAGLGFEVIELFLKKLRSVYAFDTEWDPEPDYCELLTELSQVASPRIAIAGIEAIRGDVSCQVAGHPARFSPTYMGDWTDLRAVLNGLNAALEQAGRPERFANLHSGDQWAFVILGAGSGLASMVETLGFPLEADANAPVAIGMAFEGHVADLLEQEGWEVERGKRL